MGTTGDVGSGRDNCNWYCITVLQIPQVIHHFPNCVCDKLTKANYCSMDKQNGHHDI